MDDLKIEMKALCYRCHSLMEKNDEVGHPKKRDANEPEVDPHDRTNPWRSRFPIDRRKRVNLRIDTLPHYFEQRDHKCVKKHEFIHQKYIRLFFLYNMDCVPEYGERDHVIDRVLQIYIFEAIDFKVFFWVFIEWGVPGGKNNNMGMPRKIGCRFVCAHHGLNTIIFGNSKRWRNEKNF